MSRDTTMAQTEGTSQRTYLLPLTRDPRVLEREAGVPVGTYEQLEEFTANAPTPGTAEATSYWRALRGTPMLALDTFLHRGYGEVTDEASHLLITQGLDAQRGQTRDPTLKVKLHKAIHAREQPERIDLTLDLQWFSTRERPEPHSS